MSHHFISEIVEADLASGKHASIQTRFPPEPNGYLHLGHAKSICLNFGLAAQFGGKTNLRFDDTNPTTEDAEYVHAIQDDVRWLGFDWGERALYASDYFEQLFDWAVELIRAGKAFVDDSSAEEISALRGVWTAPGKESPYRDRPVEENLDLFLRMRAGEFPDGARVLRAKIDMASGNINLRDPVMYRILHAKHHRTGDTWCIYPMYDWAHGQSDSLEKITHSICTLEFEDHRPLYDWFIGELGIFAPRQIEFARLNITHTVLSKRKLLRLVQEKAVSGWDDPRMPTLAGVRRRGVPPAALRDFCERIGVTKQESVVDYQLLDHCVREELNKTAERRMALLDPIRVTLVDYDENKVDELDAVNHPENPEAGSRKVPFSRDIWIDRDDFMEDPPKKFFRLAPGREVRLRWAYIIRCEEVVKDVTGRVVELKCTHDPLSRGGNTADGRKIQGTIHWVSAQHSVDAEVRNYDHLFAQADPEDLPEGTDFLTTLNPKSLEVVTAKVEPSLAALPPGTRVQFERTGYFVADAKDHIVGARPVFNRITTLRDSWAKTQKSEPKAP
ncbi:MAG: glutamine--tRNA ligase/YqeY domain fusion protein [Thermoanaerobaculia bacterium]